MCGYYGDRFIRMDATPQITQSATDGVNYHDQLTQGGNLERVFTSLYETNQLIFRPTRRN